MKKINVGEFIVESQNNFPRFRWELSQILSHQINKAGLAKEILGTYGKENS